MKGKKVDLIVHNAQIHTMDDNNQVHEAMAIKDGKIVEVGPERQILNKYKCDEEIDAQGKDVYPGLTDAHGHLIAYAEQKLSADLVGSKSFEEIIVRCDKYRSHSNKKFIIGRGWDQSLWNEKELPTNEKLNAAFPSILVCLQRVDGHAVLVNDYLLKKAGITANTKIDGGEVVLKNGKPTGLLVDNAINLVQKYLPQFSHKDISEAILDIQYELFQYGITGVHEAGIENNEIAIFKKLIERDKLKINVYAMLLPTKKNREFASKHGKYRYKNLSIRSFKVYADGALGSRGALLKKPYSDAN
ncbi:MAG: amidohydrolase, partial [Crocinitomicaceae bacterium]|nr:amidohydrolase [Crocinitomicaceae bacterium]